MTYSTQLGIRSVQKRVSYAMYKPLPHHVQVNQVTGQSIPPQFFHILVLKENVSCFQWTRCSSCQPMIKLSKHWRKLEAVAPTSTLSQASYSLHPPPNSWWKGHWFFYINSRHQYPVCKTQNNRNKKCTQRAQTSADPEDPDFGLWTPGSEAWSGSPPKLYHLVLEPCPTPPKKLRVIRQPDKQTDKQTEPKT